MHRAVVVVKDVADVETEGKVGLAVVKVTPMSPPHRRLLPHAQPAVDAVTVKVAVVAVADAVVVRLATPAGNPRPT